MLDYKLVEALAMVWQEQSFSRAARRLRLTQSAVSQRITLLEASVGQALLLRKPPLQLTPMGKRLLKLYQQVSSFEKETFEELDMDSKKEFKHLTIGSNADSLSTWLLPVLAASVKEERVLIRITVDDQAETTQLLKSGAVLACITSSAKAGHGCRSDYLGEMRYYCVATPEFRRRFFAGGLTKKSLASAPAVVFNNKDQLHNQYLAQNFRFKSTNYPFHLVPSSEGFVSLVLAGLAYALIPKIQIQDQLKKGELVDLMPNSSVPVPLYWHSWHLQPKSIQQVFERITKYAAKALM